MNELETKQAIVAALKDFATKPAAEAATALFDSLGYRSQKRFPLTPNTAEKFTATFAQHRPLDPKQAILDDWQSVDFLFQLTEEEVRSAAAGDQRLLFEAKGIWNGTVIESYLFFAIVLRESHYTRTELAGITRAVNRLFPMPVMLLFRCGDTLTLSVINRRLHQRDESKDVLEKVTLIKDIRIAEPHRGHLEILFDLSFRALRVKHAFTNWVELHNAWRKTLDSSELNKRFFQEIANWYFWTLEHVRFPKDAPKSDGKDHISVIRLITRLIFCWFVKEKGLIPDALFDARGLAETLDGFAPDDGRAKGSVFYRAILQNLFFATLNTEMDKRRWARAEQNFMAHSVYRFRECFRDPDHALELFQSIPFLNGGLFECLDKDLGDKAQPRYQRIDGFSRRADSQPVVPDFLFFGGEREVDLSEAYGEARYRRAKVRGLIHTFERYKFTVTENTPIEEEVALDPELSGKVFENLLAAYNPETGATARKQTGSFYTPREIVEYMVDESLLAYLQTKLDAAATAPSATDTPPSPPAESSERGERAGVRGASAVPDSQPSTLNLQPSSESRLRHLFAYNDQPHQFTPAEVETLIDAIDHLNSLDPAVGSGAFPMGILHKLVFILAKLDPNNERWRELQRQRAIRETEAAFQIGDQKEREARLIDINNVFEQNSSDYGRKLYLIENCIYGVDIQPIAVQIAKMRFFISLIVDQQVSASLAPAGGGGRGEGEPEWNRGVRPLPNLETKFVAANTLIGLKRPRQLLLRSPDIDAKEAELRRVRERHFLARSLVAKRKCRDQDAQLRGEIAQLLKTDGWDNATARRLADWDPYDQNASAEFFDPEWMFGIRDGFDIAIGNPPYVRIQTLTQAAPDQTAWLKEHYASARKGNYDLYVVFVERSLQLLQPRGHLAFILPHKFFNAQYGQPLRKLLADGKQLRHVVHFGDQQIFPGATNYVCLLFLAKAGADQCHFARADDLPAWLAEGVATEAAIPCGRVTDAEWNFAVGKGASLFNKLQRMSIKLEHVTSRIFQGIKTSADKIYIVEELKRTKASVRVFSRELEGEVELEPDLLHPLIKGGDSKRFSLTTTNRLILFPYRSNTNGSASLIPAGELKAEFPRTWDYFKANKQTLEEREDGAMRGPSWYAYGRTQALDVMPIPKIFTPDIAQNAVFSFDSTGELFFTGGVAGGYGILVTAPYRAEFILGLVNSRLLDFYHHQIATQMRGGWFSYEARFIRHLPIRPIDFADKSDRAEHDALVGLVDHILKAKRSKPTADTSALEREIDERVYRLYGLTPEEIRIVEESGK